jgi:hypothetical protein
VSREEAAPAVGLFAVCGSRLGIDDELLGHVEVGRVLEEIGELVVGGLEGARGADGVVGETHLGGPKQVFLTGMQPEPSVAEKLE